MDWRKCSSPESCLPVVAFIPFIPAVWGDWAGESSGGFSLVQRYESQAYTQDSTEIKEQTDMELTDEELQTKNEALEYAKKNKKVIGKKLTDREVYVVEDSPVSVFMAGSPGAGKTEASKALIEEFDSRILRLDIDELRNLLPGYKGGNAHLFQGGASILLEKAHDFALQQRQSFILDGTMADFNIAKRNIERSLKRQRLVQILFVYQDPKQAWKFVQAREKVEGRKVLPDKFVSQYFSSRETVNQLKQEFHDHIKLDLLIKHIDGSTRHYHSNVNQIDSHIKEIYSPDELMKIVAGIRK